MSINVNDDYEKLAKLLYPSIEASGNTYYGQTRKLTLDEVFGKNDNGFESHLESIRVPDTSSDSGFKYDVLFKWKVGPLSGSLNADTRYNTDTWFAVYEIVQDPITNENLTYSGEFNSYEYNTHAVFKRVVSTNGKSPVNLEDDYDGRNFYVAKDGIKNYIYVLLHGRFIENAPEDLNIEGIKLTAKNGPVYIELRAVGQIDSANYSSFKYKLQNDTTWNSLNLYADGISGTRISLQTNEYVLIKRLPNKVKDYNTDRYVQFVFDRTSGSNGTVDVSGNMLYMAKDQSSYSAQLDIFEFCSLFFGCNLLTSAPKLPFTNLNIACYLGMFRGCSLLEYPPKLPATVLTEMCYSSMFRSCTLLKRTPILAANDLVDGCYTRMFQGCNNLNYAECYAKVNSGSMTTAYWMNDVSNTGTFITNADTVLSEDSGDGIPAGWNHILQELPVNRSVNEDNITVLKTNGCDYVGNGRGDVSDPSTLNNMERSFDEHNLHQMNTYNIDGSLNQEVWGYKVFNSPVQFKNGIYGEGFSLIAHSTAEQLNDADSTQYKSNGSVFFIDGDNPVYLSTVKVESITNDTLSTSYATYLASKLLNGKDIYTNFSEYSSDLQAILINNYDGNPYNSTIKLISTHDISTGDSTERVRSQLSFGNNDNSALKRSYINLGIYSYDNLYKYATVTTNTIGFPDSPIVEIAASKSSNESSSIKVTPSTILISGNNNNVVFDCNAKPFISDTHDLGSLREKWRTIYCKTIYADTVNATTVSYEQDVVKANAVIPKSGATSGVGKNDAVWPYVYTNQLSINNDYGYFGLKPNDNSNIWLMTNGGRPLKIQASGVNIDTSSVNPTGDITISTKSVNVTASEDINVTASKNISITAGSGSNYSMSLRADKIYISENSTLWFESNTWVRYGTIDMPADKGIFNTSISKYGSLNDELKFVPDKCTLLLIYVQYNFDRDTSGSAQHKEIQGGVTYAVGTEQSTQSVIHVTTDDWYNVYTCIKSVNESGVYQVSRGNLIETGTKIRFIHDIRFDRSTSTNPDLGIEALVQVIP